MEGLKRSHNPPYNINRPSIDKTEDLKWTALPLNIFNSDYN